jgi:deazaflavin-dependent oxidoreductase (nitroreductase family)
VRSREAVHVARSWHGWDKRRLATALAKYAVNPIFARLAGRRFPRTHAILETTGRKSGLTRQTPVGNGLVDDTFWVIAEHGRRANYVRNIEDDPRVRVKVGGRWYRGVAELMPDDPPLARQRTLGHPLIAFMVRSLATELMTVRIDLER